MRLNLVSEKLCKSLLFKYVFSFKMRLLVLKLLQVKVVKVLFGHPVFGVKGTISDSLRLRKIFKPFRNKDKYLSITTCTIFTLKNHINLTEKGLFISFQHWALFLHKKISLNFEIKFCVSLIKHIKPLKFKIIILKK